MTWLIILYLLMVFPAAFGLHMLIVWADDGRPLKDDSIPSLWFFALIWPLTILVVGVIIGFSGINDYFSKVAQRAYLRNKHKKVP